jgi:pyruvate/2-oxoglutarate dehydrogenase complex dihydrolipoamide acyltransferase (E2) component
VAGDRLVELHAADVVVDVVAPVSGTLRERRIGEDQTLQPGDILAIIVAD